MIPKEILILIIYIFLLSKFGQNYLKREARGSVQQHVFLSQIEKFEIPILYNDFIKVIEKTVEKSDEKIDQSKERYSQAEQYLLSEIGLRNFQLKKQSTNIKNFKESFLATGRLDAEYYQKKYEQVVNKIISQKHAALINIVNITKSIEPGSAYYSEDEGLPFYRVADYNKFGLSEPDKKLSDSFVKENKEQIEKLKPKKGTILFSKDGSVGTAYLLRKDLPGITSGAILHLKVKNEKEIIPEYLTLALNSKLVQMQAERDAGGSIILHWRKEEIEKVVVPIIEFKKQQEIAELVEESFRLKAESERLLEVAKKAVEMAIEEGEEKAMEYLN